jgi:hypothetical protein
MPTINVAIAATEDDIYIDVESGSPRFFVAGESPYDGTTVYFGEYMTGYYYYACFRFILDADLSGIINTATIIVKTTDTWNWNTSDYIEAIAEDSDDAVQVADATAHPDNGSSPRTLLGTISRNPASGGLTWPASSTYAIDIKNTLQALVAKYGTILSGKAVNVWVRSNLRSQHELGMQEFSAGYPAQLAIDYTVGGGSLAHDTFFGATLESGIFRGVI